MLLRVFHSVAKRAKGVCLPIIVSKIVLHVKHSSPKFKQDCHKVGCEAWIVHVCHPIQVCINAVVDFGVRFSKINEIKI